MSSTLVQVTVAPALASSASSTQRHPWTMRVSGGSLVGHALVAASTAAGEQGQQCGHRRDRADHVALLVHAEGRPAWGAPAGPVGGNPYRFCCLAMAPASGSAMSAMCWPAL